MSHFKEIKEAYRFYRENKKRRHQEKRNRKKNPTLPQNTGQLKKDIAESIFFKQQEEFSQLNIEQELTSFSKTPLISVIMPTYKTPLNFLEKVIESLIKQAYTNWELCIVDDASHDDALKELLKDFEKKDTRIKVYFSEKNQGISASSNIGIQMAQGEYIGLLDHDDELTIDALFWVVHEINKYPNAEFFYSDECKICDTKERKLFHFFFKPDWSPEMLLNAMYTGHFTVYKTDVVKMVGGFRSKYDFSQEYDLALRISKTAKEIRHIPRILYLWRTIKGSAAQGDKPFARTSNLAALKDYSENINEKALARVIETPMANYLFLSPKEPVKVSVIIPSDSYENVKICVDELLKNTSYPGLEVVVVCNSKVAEKLETSYLYSSVVCCSRYDKKYNFSDKCNQGASVATGEIVIFYNDDVFPIDTGWIEQLISPLLIPGVGGVSPKLIRRDSTIQYAGMISGTPGLVGTSFNNYGVHQSDHFLTLHEWMRNVSVLSGACCAIWKSLFELVGGFDSINTPSAHSDIDLSYKLLDKGYRLVYTPHTILYHIGNHSWRNNEEKDKSDIYCLKRWGQYIADDPYFTLPMKKVLYDDFRYKYRIFSSSEKKEEYTNKDVLLVTHELTRTGAPMMILHAAKAILRAGGFPVVTCNQDGPLKEEFIREGITVIIDQGILMPNNPMFERFASNFDLIIVNTLALGKLISKIQYLNVSILWWIHEGKLGFEALVSQLPETINSNVKVLLASPYIDQFVVKYLPGVSFEYLECGILDRQKENNLDQQIFKDKMVFAVVGSIELRKGQDVFLSAISNLDKEYLKKGNFVILGKPLFEDFHNKIKGMASDFENVQILPDMAQSELIEFYKNIDVLVVPSRDDPGPLVAMEALMLGKPCICSTNTGIYQWFSKESNEALRFFENENDKELAAQIEYFMTYSENYLEIQRAARNIFEKNFDSSIFEKNF